MKKIDLKKGFKELFKAPSKEPVILEVPELKFLMFDGAGAPSSQAFQDAIGAMYNVAYTLKFKLKKEGVADYPVMALQGLWWTECPGFDAQHPDKWQWRLLIMQPDIVTAEMVAAVKEDIEKKKDVAALAQVRLESFHEGTVAQIMHIGPYSEEPATIQKLHQFIGDSGYKLRGHHHEIYMGDPRRAAPEKLKTIIRHPVEKA